MLLLNGFKFESIFTSIFFLLVLGFDGDQFLIFISYLLYLHELWQELPR